MPSAVTADPPMSHDYRPEELADPRNAGIQVWVGDRLWPRDQARVSVFDSAVQGGDAVWEGLRVYQGRIFRLDAHLERLLDSARALRFDPLPDLDEVRQALFATLEANGMRDGAHVRLTLTRGPKSTSGMSPRFNRKGTCLIVLAEWKPPVYAPAGIRLVTASIRRNSPQCLDSRIHHNNLLNNILAKIEADAAGVDDAVMLDLQGFVAETNATNLFLVKMGSLVTPLAESCLPGITRAVVLEIAREAGISTDERRVTPAELWAADEVFTTGTMGELAPVLEIDGRMIGDGGAGTLTRQLQGLFRERTAREGQALPF
jgi:branched-chain amino acid aminotransferase group I